MDYAIPKRFVRRVARMSEFAMGGTQVRVTLTDGRRFYPVTISTCKWIIGVEDYADLPFLASEIAAITQSDDDRDCSKSGRCLFPHAKEIIEAKGRVLDK